MLSILKKSGAVDHIIPFEGEIDWVRFMKELKENKHPGTFMYEVRGNPSKNKRKEILRGECGCYFVLIFIILRISSSSSLRIYEN